MFLEIDPPRSLGEIIEWHEVSTELPDADTTVLILEAGEVEATMGYLDGGVWRNLDSWPLPNAPVYRAHLPEGPAE